MDTLIQAILIGVVQGLTEFLPISSSAHLILLPRLLGWDNAFLLSPAFVVMLHMGTLLAVLLAASVIPGALVGLLAEDFIDTFFREQLLVICGLLVVGAGLLFAAER